jgi:hypothetical protein
MLAAFKSFPMAARFGQPLPGRFTYPVEPARAENPLKGPPTEQNTTLSHVPSPTIDWQGDGGTEDTSTYAQARKAKVKTRGTPAATTTEGVAVPDETQVEDRQPSFAVDPRALKVFRTLFVEPATTSTPGEIPWKDFLHAMASTGFLARKLYGSVWQFSPTKLDVERPIQFHEPHPHDKIPFTSATRFGRRLNRAYGWVGSMFSVKEK